MSDDGRRVDSNATESYFQNIQNTVVQKTAGSQALQGDVLARNLAFNAQCFLMQNAHSIKKHNYSFYVQLYNKKRNSFRNLSQYVTGYENFACIRSDVSNPPSEIFSQLSRAPTPEPLLEITPDQMAALVPTIRLYKIEYNDDGSMGESNEIIFDDYIHNHDVETITRTAQGRSRGTGIKKFTWKLAGTQPAEVDYNIEADLEIFFSSVQDIFSLQSGEIVRQAGIKGEASFLDLIIHSPSKATARPVNQSGDCNQQFYDGNAFVLKAVVGWAIPPTADFPTKLKEALELNKTVLYLQLTKHKFNFKQDGTATLVANYRARYAMEDIRYDVLKPSDQKDVDRLGALRKKRDDLSTADGDTNLNSQDSTEAAQENINSKIGKLLQSRYTAINDKLLNKIYIAYAEPFDLGIITNFDSKEGLTVGGREALYQAQRFGAGSQGQGKFRAAVAGAEDMTQLRLARAREQARAEIERTQNLPGQIGAAEQNLQDQRKILKDLQENPRPRMVSRGESEQAYRDHIAEDIKQVEEKIASIEEGLASLQSPRMRQTGPLIAKLDNGDPVTGRPDYENLSDADKARLESQGGVMGHYNNVAGNAKQAQIRSYYSTKLKRVTKAIDELDDIPPSEEATDNPDDATTTRERNPNEPGPTAMMGRRFDSGSRVGIPVKFLFLGDILDVIIGIACGAETRRHEVRFLIGDLEYIDTKQFIKNTIMDKGHKGYIERYRCGIPLEERGNILETINIANIPIEYNRWQDFFIQKIVKPMRERYFLETMIRDILTDLVRPVLNEGCIDVIPPINLDFGYNDFIGDREVWTSTLTRALIGTGTKHTVKSLAQGLPSEGGTPYLPITPLKRHTSFKYIFMSSANLGHRVGNEQKDKQKGIYHFSIGKSSGLVKEITFERMDQPYLREARIQKVGALGADQLRELYNVNMVMYGNNLLKPGQYTFVNPTSVGMGGFGQGSLTRLLGIGGYHLITDVKSTISRNGWETRIKALHQAMPRLDDGTSVAPFKISEYDAVDYAQYEMERDPVEEHDRNEEAGQSLTVEAHMDDHFQYQSRSRTPLDPELALLLSEEN